MHAENTSRLVTEKEAALLLQVSQRWLQQKRYRGEGPPYVQLSRNRLIRYRVDDLLDWAKALTVEGNS